MVQGIKAEPGNNVVDKMVMNAMDIEDEENTKAIPSPHAWGKHQEGVVRQPCLLKPIVHSDRHNRQ